MPFSFGTKYRSKDNSISHDPWFDTFALRRSISIEYLLVIGDVLAEIICEPAAGFRTVATFKAPPIISPYIVLPDAMRARLPSSSLQGRERDAPSLVNQLPETP